jgi:hypothetical protein
VEDEDGAKKRGRGASDCAEVGADFEACEQAEKDNDRERSNESGEPPVVERVVDLSPGQRKASSKVAELPS